MGMTKLLSKSVYWEESHLMMMNIGWKSIEGNISIKKSSNSKCLVVARKKVRKRKQSDKEMAKVRGGQKSKKTKIYPSYLDSKNFRNDWCKLWEIPYWKLIFLFKMIVVSHCASATSPYSSFNKHEFLDMGGWNVAYWALLIGWSAVWHSLKLIWIG